jgi:hypothetical protein
VSAKRQLPGYVLSADLTPAPCLAVVCSALSYSDLTDLRSKSTLIDAAVAVEEAGYKEVRVVWSHMVATG